MSNENKRIFSTRLVEMIIMAVIVAGGTVYGVTKTLEVKFEYMEQEQKELKKDVKFMDRKFDREINDIKKTLILRK